MSRQALNRSLPVVLLLLVSVIASFEDAAVALEPPQPTPLTIATPGPTLPPSREGDYPVRSQMLRNPPTPTPLPTPVTPTDAAYGYIVPPPPSLHWPLVGHLVITTYYSAAHPAIDIAGVPCGTPVLAPDSGTVVWAGAKSNGGGLVVDIDHGWALTSSNHLSVIYVNAGQKVTQGEVIAAVGDTGNARGCHLHLSVLINGAWVNPLAYLP